MKVKLQIWVLDPQERFCSIRPMYYRGSSGALVFYDLTNFASFEHLDQWIDEIRANVKTETILLIGSKSDLQEGREVAGEDGIKFAKSSGLAGSIECSAKTGEHVEEAMISLTLLMMERLTEKEEWIN